MSEMLHNNLPANIGANPQPEDSGCLAWDAVISCDEPEYRILPEGDYTFQVKDIRRGWYDGSGKLEACDKVTAILEVRTAEGTATVWQDFLLHRKMEWKISKFFCAIGFKKKGESMRMNWKDVPGAWGRAHFRPRAYTGRDGQAREVNDIAWFLDFDPDKVIPGFIDVTGESDDPFGGS